MDQNEAKLSNEVHCFAHQEQGDQIDRYTSSEKWIRAFVNTNQTIQARPRRQVWWCWSAPYFLVLRDFAGLIQTQQSSELGPLGGTLAPIRNVEEISPNEAMLLEGPCIAIKP